MPAVGFGATAEQCGQGGRLPLEGFGSAPCVGVHAGVIRGGRVSPGDEVHLAL